MEVLIHSDGQLHPREKPLPPPKPKPKPPQENQEPCPPPPPKPKTELGNLPWEDLLLIGILLLILRNSEKPDIPLLLALSYILFDQQFDLKKLF